MTTREIQATDEDLHAIEISFDEILTAIDAGDVAFLAEVARRLDILHEATDGGLSGRRQRPTN
jgi:hypothetical protein